MDAASKPRYSISGRRRSDFNGQGRKSTGRSLGNNDIIYTLPFVTNMTEEDKLCKLIETAYKNAFDQVAHEFYHGNKDLEIELIVRGDEAKEDLVKSIKSSGVLKDLVPSTEEESELTKRLKRKREYLDRLDGENEMWDKLVMKENKRIDRVNKMAEVAAQEEVLTEKDSLQLGVQMLDLREMVKETKRLKVQLVERLEMTLEVIGRVEESYSEACEQLDIQSEVLCTKVNSTELPMNLCTKDILSPPCSI